MPLYDYECPNCGLVEDIWAKMDEQEKLCRCGNLMKRVLSASNISPDWQPYFDENLCKNGSRDGQWVKSRQHRKELMQRCGLVDIG